jgi:hypothetical protein
LAELIVYQGVLGTTDRQNVENYLAVKYGMGLGLKASLVSYWKLDETSGTRNDSWGSNHLTDNNTVTSATGIQGNDAVFVRANSEYLSCASNSTLEMSSVSFTIAAWVKLTTVPSSGSGIEYSLVTKDSASGRDYTLCYVATAGSFGGFRFYVSGGGSGVVETGVPATAAVWYFVVAWYDNGIIYIRVNDLSTSSLAAPTPVVSNTEFRIGARQYSTNQDFADAEIDEVGLWKRVLSPAEITQLYNGGAGLPFSSW